MNKIKRSYWLISLLLALFAGAASAQVATTTVNDTVYRADGTPAGGSVIINWNAFTTANGSAIPAGSTTVTLATGGLLHVALAPNAGSTPMGNYYTAVYHLNDGTTSREFWVIPVTVPGGGPAKLAGIRNSVLPTSVAMQSVSRQYVDNAISRAQIGPLDTSPYVVKAGDTMTGPLELPADPVSANQAADKNYVDTNITAVTSGLDGKVSKLPSATQVIAQPTGTDLEVNRLNGDLVAGQYQTGAGNNGIANALLSTDCGTGCLVHAESSYAGVETVFPQNLHSQQQVIDQRGGADSHTTLNAIAPGSVLSQSTSVLAVETQTAPQFKAARPASIGLGAYAQSLEMDALTGGANIFPEAFETAPYAKSTYGTLNMVGKYNTPGQHVQMNNFVFCYSVGDCLAGGQQIVSSGGFRDSADEGAHPFDLLVTEDLAVYTGTCSSGCTTGSTSLNVVSSNQGIQGEGRYLIDKNPANVISTGTLSSGSKTIFGTANFIGTSFPVSTFFQTTSNAISQPTDIAPGTVNLAIATSGVPSGFATNTAALAQPSGVACIADGISGDTRLPNFETATYSTVDSTHLQLTLNKPHRAPSTISVGGLCGYGLEQTVDTTNGLRQVFPVIGAYDATDLYYADSSTQVVGNNLTTSGFLHYGLTVATIARSANVVTVTTTAAPIIDMNGLRFTVTGVADSSYNGTFTVTTTGPNTFTYPNTGPNSTSTGGALDTITGGFALYPMAEVLGITNPATSQIDGTFKLAPNTVAWAAGDDLEEPHFYQALTRADTEYVNQFMPRPGFQAGAGKIYGGQVGPGFRGWQIENIVPDSNYLGAGGTHALPDVAMEIVGPWNESISVTAGANALIHAHCNLHGCNRWNSAYAVLQLDSARVGDSLSFDPANDAAYWNMQGTFYSFTPSAFNAPTINVGTLNATTITGGVSGSAITSGTISPVRLPVFGPSGTTHAAGIVPDPGATAGSTHFLREDGTWSVPSGSGGGSPTGSAGGDLGGTYPNPTVVALHATAGTANNVVIGGTTPAAGSFTTATATTYNIGSVGSIANNGGSVELAAATTGGGNGNLVMEAGNAGFFTTNTVFYVCTPGTVSCPFIFAPATGILQAPSYREALTTPTSSSAACTAGDFTDDANFHYVCTATNTWKRVALSSF